MMKVSYKSKKNIEDKYYVKVNITHVCDVKFSSTFIFYAILKDLTKKGFDGS